MDIVLVRVDNRLVHGQILEAWMPCLGASCLVVADDGVANDFFRESVIRMSVPRGVDLVVTAVKDLGAKVPFSTGNGKRTIVLFANVADAVRARRAGFLFSQLNLGNVRSEDCLHACTPSVNLGKDDILGIRELRAQGVRINLQRVPRECAVDIDEALKD